MLLVCVLLLKKMLHDWRLLAFVAGLLLNWLLLFGQHRQQEFSAQIVDAALRFELTERIMRMQTDRVEFPCILALSGRS